jgi:outer membrane biosynthesis protein TonB
MELRLLARFRTPRQRLGLGATLAAAVHLAGLTALGLVVIRAGRSLVAGDEVDGDRVEVSTVGEPAPGLPGPPAAASTPDPRAGDGPALEGESEVEAPRPASRTRTGTRPRRAAAPARATTFLAAPRARAAARAPLLATTTPTSIDVGGGDSDGPALPGAPGAAASSTLVAFRAELKQRMRAAWRAREVYYRIDPHGRLEGSLLITRLHVRLRPDGTVATADLQDSSGVQALDAEAVAAIGRMKPLTTRLPPELVDARGSALVSCAFHLDLGQYRFANHLRRAVAELWRPARAYMASSDVERVTRVRLKLDREGALLGTQVIASAGIDFLDSNALNWATPGTRLPRPPPAFHRGDTEVPVFVAFHHLAGQVHFLWPREDPDAE